MANTLYPKFKESLLTGGANLSTANVKAVLVDFGAYTYSAAHQYLSDIPVGARISTSPNLTTKTITSGVFDADDTTFTAVPATSVEAVVLYIDTGTAATSQLIIILDTVTGLPITTSGGDVALSWDNGANRIFAL